MNNYKYIALMVDLYINVLRGGKKNQLKNLHNTRKITTGLSDFQKSILSCLKVYF